MNAGAIAVAAVAGVVEAGVLYLLYRLVIRPINAWFAARSQRREQARVDALCRAARDP